MLKIIREILSLAIELFHVTGCLIKKHPVPTKRASVRLIKVKSCDELLRMLLMCVAAVCLRSVMRFFFLFWIPVFRALYLRERGCEDPWLFFKAKWSPRGKTFEKH